MIALVEDLYGLCGQRLLLSEGPAGNGVHQAEGDDGNGQHDDQHIEQTANDVTAHRNSPAKKLLGFVTQLNCELRPKRGEQGSPLLLVVMDS